MDGQFAVIAALKLIGKPATIHEIVKNQPTTDEWVKVFPFSRPNRNKKSQVYKKGTLAPAISLLVYEGRIVVTGKEGRCNQYYFPKG